jgi:hypothetical protein
MYSWALRKKEKYEKMLEFDLFSDIMADALCRIESLSDCTEAGLAKEIRGRARNAVYVILAREAQFLFQKDTLESVRKKAGFRMSRMNKQDEWKTEDGCYCLYVGSAKGNVVKQLVPHLGIAGDNPQVYALHLAQWWPEAAVRIYVRQFRGEAEPYVQEIEDMLWDHYRPIFGGAPAGGENPVGFHPFVNLFRFWLKISEDRSAPAGSENPSGFHPFANLTPILAEESAMGRQSTPLRRLCFPFGRAMPP